MKLTTSKIDTLINDLLMEIAYDHWKAYQKDTTELDPDELEAKWNPLRRIVFRHLQD